MAKENKEKSSEEKRPTRKVSNRKIETVKKLAELIKNSNTLMIVSIKNLPSRQFQDIRKKLRENVEIKVVKKNAILKAIDESENKSIEDLKKYVQEDSAVLFSKEDAFALAGILAENKNPIKAKSGQEAVEDITIEEGPTDLTPGPAISELGGLGIKIAVEEGKIAIKEKKVIAKKGEKISEAAASIMAKLDIKPFKIGLEPLAVCEIKTGKIYTNVKIDKEKTIEELKVSANKAIGFAQKIAYYCKETICFLLAKANANAGALEKFVKEKAGEKEEIKNTNDKKEEIKQNQENKSIAR